jgi:hypothetical protein
MDLITAFARQILLFGHALMFAFALVAVVREDRALLSATQIDTARLAAAGRQVSALLGGLWLSGLAMIAMQPGLDLAGHLGQPKLAAKLTVVSLLTGNGVFLHLIAFPLLARRQRNPRRVATVCAVLGGVSTATWLYASFVGLARSLAAQMTYAGFIALYAVVLVTGVAVALVVGRPRLERLMMLGPRGDIEEPALHLTQGASASAEVQRSVPNARGLQAAELDGLRPGQSRFMPNSVDDVDDASAAETPHARTLRQHELWRVTPTQATRLHCLRGCVWVTADGDSRDVVLKAPESFQPRPGVPLIVDALENSSVQLGA